MSIQSLDRQYGPMRFLHRTLLFVSGVFLVLAVFWPIPHPQWWLAIAAVLFSLSCVLWIPATIYGDLPIHYDVLYALKVEAEQFPKLRLAWQVVCQSEHPTWKELEDMLFLARHTQSAGFSHSEQERFDLE